MNFALLQMLSWLSRHQLFLCIVHIILCVENCKRSRYSAYILHLLFRHVNASVCAYTHKCVHCNIQVHVHDQELTIHVEEAT